MAQYGPRQVAGLIEGQVIAGKFRVERVLGVGGMGVVVAAHHIGLDDKVAIKFLLPEMLSDAEAVSRFAREARNAVRIRGEHMARVFDVGALETGAPYMVMEFLEGVDLHSWLQQRGPLAFKEAVDFVLQACEVVAEAHALGIWHRDLKPANLFCIRSADGRLSIKVLDFGISKASSVSASPSNLVKTETAALIGTPFYMSPEQMEATHPVDHRTDIWSLGVILHELVTGKVPFPGATQPEVSIKVHSRPPPLLREFRPDAPDGLQAVVLRCLEKDRERRYHNVAELALALLPFGPKRAKASVERITDIIQTAGLTTTALSVPPSSELGGQQVAAETIPPLGRTASGSRSGKAMVGIFAVVVVVALVGGVSALRYVYPNAQTTDAGAPFHPAQALEAGNVTPVEAGEAQMCAPGSTRCSGNTPQTCASTGQWEDRAPCPYKCSGGACVGVCVPGRTQCSSIETVHTCGLDGQWAKPVLCDKSSRCRDGLCTPSIAPASPKLDCDPNYTIDPKSGAHIFKPQCFAK